MSQNATVCKSCGTENPAVLQQPKDRKAPEASNLVAKVPDNTENRPGSTRMTVGIIVILIIAATICIRFSSGSDNSTRPATATQHSLTSDASHDDAEAIVFDVSGSYGPHFSWVIRKDNGGLQFQYVASDAEGQTVIKSGDCVALTYGQLTAESPNTFIRGRSISPDKKILLIGPIDVHYNADYSERPIYGILVASKDSSAKLYINDTDNPDEFVLMDNLNMKVK